MPLDWSIGGQGFEPEPIALPARASADERLTIVWITHSIIPICQVLWCLWQVDFCLRNLLYCTSPGHAKAPKLLICPFVHSLRGSTFLLDYVWLGVVQKNTFDIFWWGTFTPCGMNGLNNGSLEESDVEKLGSLLMSLLLLASRKTTSMFLLVQRKGRLYIAIGW